MTQQFQTATPREKDPAFWCAVIASAFFLLVLHRLGIPSKPMFDEVHYLPAARRLIDLTSFSEIVLGDGPADTAHPAFAKMYHQRIGSFGEIA